MKVQNQSGKKAKVITVANQKGGVGKTTTTMNIGAALSKLGLRVLLIDSDPQANLTSYLGVAPSEDASSDDPHADVRTLDELYLSKRAITGEAALDFVAKSESGIDVIPSDGALSGVEFYLFSRSDKELVLSRFLDSLRERYDFILIDTPPSLNLLTLNALCASDHVLIPVQPEFFSLEGIVKIREAITDVQARWNPKLSIIGVLATQITQRRRLTGEVLDALRSELGEIFFESMIHENAAVTESTGHAQSVLDYDRSSRGAKDYWAAAEELARRCGVKVAGLKTDLGAGSARPASQSQQGANA